MLNPRFEVEDLCPAPSALTSVNPPEVDLVVTLGGDGTILHVSSLYARAGRVPPVVSFSMGSLGFLLPFRKSRLFFLVHARSGCVSVARPGPSGTTGVWSGVVSVGGRRAFLARGAYVRGREAGRDLIEGRSSTDDEAWARRRRHLEPRPTV